MSNVDTILLDQSRMRAITGAGEHLTIIPSMDGTPRWTSMRSPIPRRAECRFIYAETATFGPDVEEFHKTTFQDPPDGALISEGAAAYRDADYRPARVRRFGDHRRGLRGRLGRPAIRRRLEGRRQLAAHCGPAAAAATIGCGRWPLLEVTFCGFPQSVSDIVMTNIVANVPG